jgi:hypothetical protein
MMTDRARRWIWFGALYAAGLLAFLLLAGTERRLLGWLMHR